MKRTTKLTVLLSIAMLTLAASFANASPQKNAEQTRLQKQAKITIDQARETALKRAPGNVEGGELEREHGRLVYSFDIRNAKGTIDEVQVSALTGKVVRVEHENKKQEAAEKRKESQEKARKP